MFGVLRVAWSLHIAASVLSGRIFCRALDGEDAWRVTSGSGSSSCTPAATTDLLVTFHLSLDTSNERHPLRHPATADESRILPGSEAHAGAPAGICPVEAHRLEK